MHTFRQREEIEMSVKEGLGLQNDPTYPAEELLEVLLDIRDQNQKIIELLKPKTPGIGYIDVSKDE